MSLCTFLEQMVCAGSGRALRAIVSRNLGPKSRNAMHHVMKANEVSYGFWQTDRTNLECTVTKSAIRFP